MYNLTNTATSSLAHILKNPSTLFPELWILLAIAVGMTMLFIVGASLSLLLQNKKSQ